MIKYIYLIIVFASTEIIGTSFASGSVASWDWDYYYLHSGPDVNRFDNESLLFRLNECLENLNDKSKCKYSRIDLMSLTKKDKVSSLGIANRFVENISDSSSNEFYLKYLRRIAVQSQAYSGQVDNFLMGIRNHPSMEDAYILANGGDYSLGNIVLNYLQGSSSGLYCRATRYIQPFLLQNNINNGVYYNTLISNIDNTNYQIADCSINRILEFPILFTEEIQLKLKSLIESNNSSKHRLSVELEGKYSLTYDIQIISNILQKSITATDINTWHYLNKLLMNLNVISHSFPLEDPQAEGPNNVIVTNRFKGSFKEETLLAHDYNNVWISYLQQINFRDAKNFLVEMNKSISNGIDTSQKIFFMKDLPLVNSNRLLKTLLADAAVKSNSPFASNLLNELYANATGLQLNALIARYPIQLATKPVVKLNSNDPWIQLAELTNLLTICNIDVPPPENELSDPVKLTKYLEDGNELLEGCSRVAGKH